MSNIENQAWYDDVEQVAPWLYLGPYIQGVGAGVCAANELYKNNGNAALQLDEDQFEFSALEYSVIEGFPKFHKDELIANGLGRLVGICTRYHQLRYEFNVPVKEVNDV